MPQKDLAKREIWRERVAGWQASGGSAAEWCRQNKVSYDLFLYWRGVLARENRIYSFEEIKEEPAHASPIAVEIGQAKIVLDSDFDELVFEKCVRALAKATC